MTHAEILKRRADPSGPFVILKDAHVTIAGNRAAGITYAALELRAFPGGPGDTEPLAITVAEIQAVQGQLRQNRETILLSIKRMLQSGVLTASRKRGRDNCYRLQLNWPKICDRIGLPENQQPVAGKPAEEGGVGCRKTGNPNKEVRDMGGKRQLRDHPPIPPSSTKHLGGWTPLHSQIKKLLLEYSDLYPDDRWNNQTVRNFAREIQGEEADRLLEQLGSTLHQQATGQERRCRGWGGLIERASSWREQPWCASRKPADRLQALVDRARARALERA